MRNATSDEMKSMSPGKLAPSSLRRSFNQPRLWGWLRSWGITLIGRSQLGHSEPATHGSGGTTGENSRRADEPASKIPHAGFRQLSRGFAGFRLDLPGTLL